MPSSRLLSLFFKPSLFSFVALVIVVIATILSVNWPYFTYNHLLYAVLYGEFGAVTALEKSPALTQGLIEGFTANPLFYGIVVTIAAAMVGLVVFLFVRGLKSGVHSIEEFEDTFERHSILQRVGVRVFVGSMWGLYTFVFVSVVLPFCLLMSRIGAESIVSFEGILMNLGAFLLLLLTFHLHVVFMRLLLLRPRVFGGRAVIQDAAFSQGAHYRH